jgi:hypothetical protein
MNKNEPNEQYKEIYIYIKPGIQLFLLISISLHSVGL